MLYTVLIFLSFLQSVIGFTLMTSSTMIFREPFKRRIMAGFVVMLSGISLLSYTLFTKGGSSVDRFAILIILGIELSWFLICSKDRFFVLLFSFLSFANIYISISYISDNLAADATGNDFIIERIFIRTVIYVIILPLLFKFVRERFRRLVDTLDNEWRAAAIVPFMFLIMQTIVLYYPEPYWRWNNNNWSRLVIITVYILFLSVYYLLYIQASAIVEKYALEKRQLFMAQQEKLWESELIRQKAVSAMAFQQRHDMHHHNAVINSLLKSGDINNLKVYMKSYDSALNTHNVSSYCLNPIVNSIMNICASRIEEENIKTVFQVSVPEVIGIDNIDLTCVLANAIENALEGCLRLPANAEKEILVIIKYINSRLRVKVENTCRNDIIFEGDLPVTQKTGGGMGTKSILYTAERYDGMAGFAVTNGKFITRIVLNAN